jgi:hypothetical protein
MTKKTIKPPNQETEDKLDEALAETFPASDPVAMTEPSPRSPEPRKSAARRKKAK